MNIRGLLVCICTLGLGACRGNLPLRDEDLDKILPCQSPCHLSISDPIVSAIPEKSIAMHPNPDIPQDCGISICRLVRSTFKIIECRGNAIPSCQWTRLQEISSRDLAAKQRCANSECSGRLFPVYVDRLPSPVRFPSGARLSGFPESPNRWSIAGTFLNATSLEVTWPSYLSVDNLGNIIGALPVVTRDTLVQVHLVAHNDGGNAVLDVDLTIEAPKRQ